MGRTHAATGLLAGLLVGPLVGLHGIPEVAPFAATCAGYALLPDLDHPSSTATRKLGMVTEAISAGLRAMSRALYRATKGPRDEDWSGEHRHATHTLIFAGLAGGLCWASTSMWGGWAVAAWLGFGLLLAYDRLGWLALVSFSVGAVAWIPRIITGSALAVLDQSSGWLGAAVALGCVVHCLGDALTESGCPFLFPLYIRGETWYEIRPPAWLRFRTGTPVETAVIYPLVLVGCVAATPGIWHYLTELGHVASTVTAQHVN